MRRFMFACVTIGFLHFAFLNCAVADPCGMVPPIFVDNASPIERIGVQKTYVFYKDGLETIVLRPGFSGKADEFGMLIPFPSPPAIRKVPDDIFTQIAAAIDPPEVVIDVRPVRFFGGMGGGFGGGGGMGGGGGLSFSVPKNEVRVIEEKAVGMYEVAVLAAGSADALKKWMDNHKYRYPSGMDLVCPDYVKSGWCFVAVKTKVKQKDAADPRPGQRKVDNDLPDGAKFDGFVQAMGFRFPTRNPVIPMRLSVFNPGDLRNVTFLLTDRPAQIRQLPTGMVKRQLSGMKLYDNLTRPLPVRVIGGTAKDIPVARKRSLEFERDPHPFNGAAAELFASDLIAARTRRLMSDHETLQEELVSISEELDLRGGDIDKNIEAMFEEERRRAVRAALKGLDKMTLTVIDGDFPRDVIGAENLTLASYEMPRERSRTDLYDAKLLGPPEKKEGKLYLGIIELPQVQESQIARRDESKASTVARIRTLGSLLVSAFVIGILLSCRIRKSRRTTSSLLILLLLSAPMLQIAVAIDRIPKLPVLIDRLGEPDRASKTADQIVTLGEAALPALFAQTRSKELSRKGWAIVCLSRIGGDESSEHLKKIYTNQKQPELVRIWAAAAMVKTARSNKEMQEVVRLAKQYPALGRPIAIEFRRRMAPETIEQAVEGMLLVAAQTPQIEKAIAKEILSVGPRPLVFAMLNAKDTSVRMKAAAYVATLGANKENAKLVGNEVARAVRFNPMIQNPPWHGGALFLPAIPWQKDEAQLLVTELISWRVWAELNDQREVTQQIENNLASIALANVAGYAQPPKRNATEWLRSWKAAVGNEAVRKIIAAQGAENQFGDLLD